MSVLVSIRPPTLSIPTSDWEGNLHQQRRSGKVDMDGKGRGGSMAAAKALLDAHPLRNLCASPGKRVLVLRGQASLGQALKLLAQHAVLAAPVVEDGYNGTESVHFYSDQWPRGEPFPNVVGFVSAHDILGGCLLEVQEALGHAKTVADDAQTMRMLELHVPDVESRKLRSLPGMQDGDFLFAAEMQRTLLDVVQNSFLCPRHLHLDDPPMLDSRRPKGTGSGPRHMEDVPRFIHRMAILDDDDRICDVVSVSDVMAFLLRHVRELGALAYMQVRDLRLGLEKEVFTIKANEPSIKAFAGMYERGYSSAAVLSSITGIMIGNISMSDLRCLDLGQFGRLALPVSDFILYTESVRSSVQDVARTRIRDSKGRKFLRRPRLVTCTAAATFEEVLKLLVHNSVHRVYVMDDLSLPIGVITPTDILQLLAGTDV